VREDSKLVAAAEEEEEEEEEEERQRLGLSADWLGDVLTRGS